MGTCANSGQAVGIAAALCHQKNLFPRDILKHIKELQIELSAKGQHIPQHYPSDPTDLTRKATLSASSELKLSVLEANGPLIQLEKSWAMMIPVEPGKLPCMQFCVDASEATNLMVELRISNHPDNHTPDTTLAKKEIALTTGAGQWVTVDFDVCIDQSRYVFVCLMQNERVQAHASEFRVTGLLNLRHRGNQEPPADIGIETFEFWSPLRRPAGQNFAMCIEPAIELFGPANLANVTQRPTNSPNAWVADPQDPSPHVELSWSDKQWIKRIELYFDTDFDHPMESVLMGHPERAMPYCVRDFTIEDAAGNELTRIVDNHQTHLSIPLETATETDRLIIRIHSTHGLPAALFKVSCYSE